MKTAKVLVCQGYRKRQDRVISRINTELMDSVMELVAVIREEGAILLDRSTFKPSNHWQLLTCLRSLSIVLILTLDIVNRYGNRKDGA